MSDTILAPVVIAFAVGSWLLCAVNMILAVRYRKPDVPLWLHPWGSPFNILFMPSKLTERGLLARKRCFLGAVGLFAAMIVGMIIGGMK